MANADSDNVSVIDTTTNNVTATVNAGIYPTGVVIVPFMDSNMTAQSTGATSNTTEGIGVEEPNLSSPEEKKAVKFSGSNNNSFESDNGNSPSENDSSKDNSTPGFSLLGGLICLYGMWKFRKK
ncbi:hypothetical protein [Methanosarcina barkeri]